MNAFLIAALIVGGIVAVVAWATPARRPRPGEFDEPEA